MVVSRLSDGPPDLQHAGTYPVLAQTAPGAIRRALPGQPPAHPEALEAILADFDHLLMPGITHRKFIIRIAISNLFPSFGSYTKCPICSSLVNQSVPSVPVTMPRRLPMSSKLPPLSKLVLGGKG
jgi:hypothetical protein